MCADTILFQDLPTNWGRWGKEDERGALNLLTPERTMAALQVCRSGVVYHLGLPIQQHGSGPIFDYRGAPQRLTLTNQADSGQFTALGAPPDVGANEDMLVLASHTLTHMDALGHVFAAGTLYNGFPAAAVRTNSGMPTCGIDKVGGVVGRAVHLDLPRHQGVDWLEPGHVITGAELDACARGQGVEIRPGDILLVRTGFLDYWHSLGDPSAATAQAGLGLDAVGFIRDHDVAVVGSDNSAIESLPFDQGIFLGVHIELLVKLGVHLIEHVNLSGLSADQISEGLFIAAPLCVTGASGSPVNPIVIG
ncbi:MAG: cyclase family protein [Acidimicrobiales bacterium]